MTERNPWRTIAVRSLVSAMVGIAVYLDQPHYWAITVYLLLTEVHNSTRYRPKGPAR